MVERTIRLNDGRSMPRLGLGVYQVPDAEAATLVRGAIEDGYRLIDTAAMYGNEAGVGAGVRAAAGVASSDIFVTTKLRNDMHGYDRAHEALDASLSRLGEPRVDLYLIHWPLPGRDLYVDTWRALIEQRDAGRCGSIGVSNFTVSHLERLIGETGVVPAVNQVELHPRFQQRALRAFHDRHGIVTESWAPLGRARVLDDPVLAGLARKHGRTVAQVVVRWHLQSDLVAIPKSAHPSRVRDNADVWGFALVDADMAAIAGMDMAGGRSGPDPDTFG